MTFTNLPCGTATREHSKFVLNEDGEVAVRTVTGLTQLTYAQSKEVTITDQWTRLDTPELDGRQLIVIQNKSKKVLEINYNTSATSGFELYSKAVKTILLQESVGVYARRKESGSSKVQIEEFK